MCIKRHPTGRDMVHSCWTFETNQLCSYTNI